MNKILQSEKIQKGSLVAIQNQGEDRGTEHDPATKDGGPSKLMSAETGMHGYQKQAQTVEYLMNVCLC